LFLTFFSPHYSSFQLQMFNNHKVVFHFQSLYK
jgi:hypothetical protein